MGNLCVKRKKQQNDTASQKYKDSPADNIPAPEPQKPLKSWEIRRMQQKDKNFYQCIGKTNETVIKEPGSLAGQQYKIENCNGCEIYVLDHSTTIFVDDCVDCSIFIGPCKASVFVRDCKNCKMVIACQQYRSRDCKDISTLLYCQSQPVIESSTNMKFGCFFFAYPQLAQQFVDCGLPPWTNNWSDIYDFTKNPNGKLNFSYILEKDGKRLIPSANEKLPSICQEEYTQNIANSPVPITKGLQKFLANKSQQEQGLLLLFPEVVKEKSNELIVSFNTSQAISLIRTAEIVLDKDERAEFIFSNVPNNLSVRKAHNFQLPCIFIQLRGDNQLDNNLQEMFKSSADSFVIWRGKEDAYQKLCQTIFENWADERS